MSLYRNVLKKAWEITWRHKYLWFFGLFASILLSGGEYDYILYFINSDQGGLVYYLQSMASAGLFTPAIFQNIALAIASDPVSFVIVIFILLIILALFAFLIWLVIVSQISIISSTAKISAGSTSNFKESIDAGLSHFWKVLLFNVLQKMIISLFVAITLAVFIYGGFAAGFAVQVFVFIIMLLLSVFIAFVVKYAINYIVVKNKSFNEALADAWKLFHDNWLVTIEMTIIIAVLSVGLAMAAIFFMFTISSPFVFIALLSLKYGSMFSFWLTVFVAAVVFLVLAFLIGAVFSVFQNAAWTCLFLELVSAGGKSKIMRLLNKNQ